MKRYLKGLGIIITAIQLQACGEMEIPDPNPGGNTGVDFTININNSPFTSLKNVGNAIIVTGRDKDQNEKGKIIIVKPAENTIPLYVALQGTCPNDASINLTYNSSNGTFVCSKDNSTYDINGRGSSANLKKYITTFLSNTGEIRIFE